MTAHQAFHRVAAMTRVLGVSPSGYYAWRKRPLSARACVDVELTAEIQAIHRESRGTYGAPRVHAELAARGIHVGRKRVARLMRRAGVHGVSRRRQFATTVRDESARPAPDLVDRQFQAAGPDRLWVADITYVPTWAGFLFLAVVLDAWSRRVVGWAMETHLRTELVLAALDMAVAQRRPTDVIHHSDQGCQYTSIAFGNRCREAGVQPSMGSVGDAYDNAMCDSFFATLECELLDRQRFHTPAEARLAVFDFIEGWSRYAASPLGARLPLAPRLRAGGGREWRRAARSTPPMRRSRFHDIVISEMPWHPGGGRRSRIPASRGSSCASRTPSGAPSSRRAPSTTPCPGVGRPCPNGFATSRVAHASEVLRVEVTRAALRPSPGGAPNWKRWRLAQAVRRAAPRRRKPRT